MASVLNWFLEPRPRAQLLATTGYGLCTILVNAWLLYYFHDRYWYPTDDGFYAHIAERLLSGDVLNAGIQDVHPGLIHFVHAWAFRAFGANIVSLRYPLMAAALVQAAAAFVLLCRRDALLAACGATAMTALGVVQFLDPTPNWYSLMMAVLVACWLTLVPIRSRYRLFGAGFLVAVSGLLRQPSGAVTAMAVLSIALHERSDDSTGRQLVLSRILLLAMAGLLLAYVVFSRETEPGGVLLISVWPIAFLAWSIARLRIRNLGTLAVVGQLVAGGLVPVVPLVIYHVIHRSLAAWFSDIVLVSARVTSLPHFGHGWYGVLPIAALFQIVSLGSFMGVVNGIYWVVVPMMSAANGFWLILRLSRRGWAADLILPVIAAFYSMVSLYLEGPLYLYFAVGLTLIALLSGVRRTTAVARLSLAGGCLALASVAVWFHAGQDRDRTPAQILGGIRRPLPSGVGLRRSSVRMTDIDRRTYGELVDLIQTQTAADDYILALPNDAELYFLAERRNPTRFYNSALGIQTEGDWNSVQRQLHEHPPSLVLFRPDDKWNTAMSMRLMNEIRSGYALTRTVSGLEVYRRR